MLLLRKSKTLLCLVLAIVFVLTSSISIGGAFAAGTTVNKPIIGQVKIGTKSSINVKNVQLIPSNNKQTLAFTIEIVNNENKPIMFYDYWTKVKLSNGASIPVKLTNVNVNKSEISPKTSAEYTYVGTVNRNTKYTDVIIQLIKWDFSVANYTRILGSIKMPATYSPINNAKEVFVEGTKLSVNYTNFRTYQLEEEKRIEFDVEYLNLGYRSVTIPKYKYFYMTPDNYLYEVTPVKTDDVKIQPKAKVKLQMKMVIPTAVKATTGSISLVFNDEQSKLEVPVLTSTVKLAATAIAEKPVTLGTEKGFLMNNNKYAVRLDSIKQLPWEDENIISSTVTILNKTPEVLPIPDILGVYYLDGVSIAADKTKKTQITSGVGIPANGSVEIAIHTKTAYTSPFTTVKLELNNQIKTEGTDPFKEKITTYSVPRVSFENFSKVAVNDSVIFNTGGKASGYKIHSLEAYEGANDYLYNILLEVENKDGRAAALNKLVAYFKGQNDNYFPVKISEVKDKINPNSKVIVSLSARIPSYINTNSMKLILGELIDENTYLAASEFEIPIQAQGNVDGSLKNLAIYPYKLSFGAMTVDLDRNATINFQYELSKLNEYQSVPDGHSIIMEVVDKDASYTKEFKFETDLLLGSQKQTMVAEMNIDNPNLKISQMDGLKINIYDQYQGYRKLLGTRIIYAIMIK
ncbi:hypothetical protein [Cohnella abietis]|uniref:Uncharacterized protein n=1 Tax=Cohnella abietis TaxID=2507935 RepID=A0A3T1DDY4_9BACL|nr:hypothetical protein [Cohnella abietis]BBI36188.1 hypothetical protein KCTCHS21_55870 [Cohnella abietis]